MYVCIPIVTVTGYCLGCLGLRAVVSSGKPKWNIIASVTRSFLGCVVGVY